MIDHKKPNRHATRCTQRKVERTSTTLLGVGVLNTKSRATRSLKSKEGMQDGRGPHSQRT
jgi:hypothetical protein